MKQINTVRQLAMALEDERLKGKIIGFVPTMGALHAGHLSLVDQAAEECSVVVVSIFVNPTQFNDPGDLKNYPRTLEADIQALSAHTCHYLFVPDADEIYPEPDHRIFDFGSMGEVMEGAFRPGHFNGVAQVVSRLFDIVKPDKAYFGLKDFQQLAIIRQMVQQLNLPVTIVPCDIVREADGLAMSSRNTLLTPEHRKAAPLIRKTLLRAREQAFTLPLDKIKSEVIETINGSETLKVEYFEVVDATTLQPVGSLGREHQAIGCIAVFAGKVRLIDNILF